MSSFGFITTDSSSSQLQVSAYATSDRTPVVGRSVYVDIELEDGQYRALGTVTDITTQNSQLKDPRFNAAASKEMSGNMRGTDTRTLGLKIQSTYYRLASEDNWQKASSALPTSPATGTPVRLLGLAEIEELVHDDVDNLIHLGTMRGLPGVHAPLVLPDFASQTGARHAGVLGRSGAGKTSFATFTLASQMSHESHGMIVIDPQGQWSSENGFLFSVQKFAKALGREASVLRVSEDIKLPMDQDLLSALFSEVDLWGRGFQRMGQENKEAFSEAVTERLISKYWDKETDFDNMNPQELLAGAFLAIARSTGALRRIYASVDRMESFAFALRVMAGAVLPDARADLEAEQEEKGEPVSAEEWEDAEHTWNHRLLPRFIPLINLFTNKNLHGTKRTPLGGQKGFLTGVMQVRSADPAVPAPYVILDMSSDVSAHEKSAYAAASGKIDTGEQMRAMLDNADIKALIVSTVLDEIKKASETAFAEGGGNLNTQIIFDEAWRYAPNVSNSEADTPIGKLSSKLEGFALDTRKYGIGWTYILQSPSDLNKGIWKQLTFVYTGFGIIGADKGMLGGLMDEKEKDGQMGLYDQFAPPTSTGKYPFMITGPISPLIFTNTPVFVDAYNSVEDFVEANSHWIERIVERRSLPSLNASALGVGRKPKQKKTVKKDSSSPTRFVVGGSTKSSASKPQFTPKQTEPKKREIPTVDSGFDVEEPPF